jgi:transposase
MSLKMSETREVPAETAKVAKKAFRKGNRYVVLRDRLGVIYEDKRFEAMFSSTGQPGYAPGLLALVTVVQYMEDLSDREIADAVCARIDLKYLLGLALDDEGFDHSILSEFRNRLLDHKQVESLLDEIVKLCVAQGMLKQRGDQRTDATHVLAGVRNVNRYELVGETLRHLLNSIALVAPDWLQSKVPVHWYERYVHRIELFRLPKSSSQRLRWAEEVGADGQQLLQWLAEPETPAYLQALPACSVLQQIWQQQYHLEGEIRWRQAGELPSGAEMIQSPYDLHARYSKKGDALEWDGYKTFFTESCETDALPLVTCVKTTMAAESDFNLVTPIHEELQRRDLLPQHHMVDGGFISADNCLQSQEDYKVELLGPASTNTSWQARTNSGCALEDFQVDWSAQKATCPAGHQSKSWLPDAKSNTILVRFDRHTCHACPLRSACTRAVKGPRSLRLRPQPEHDALQHLRQRQQQETFSTLYRKRAGIEGTFALAMVIAGLRRSRFRSLDKTHLQHVATAVALNLYRIANFFLGRTITREYLSPFAALAP